MNKQIQRKTTHDKYTKMTKLTKKFVAILNNYDIFILIPLLKIGITQS